MGCTFRVLLCVKHIPKRCSLLKQILTTAMFTLSLLQFTYRHMLQIPPMVVYNQDLGAEVKYGFTDEAINIFRNIYSKALATLVLNGKSSKLLEDLRECLRQGGCGSMGIFCSGVNPLLQLLEHRLEGITLYEAPVLGPVSETEKTVHGIKKNEKVIGYVDDIAPYITKK